jgi:hypothetical protein
VRDPRLRPGLRPKVATSIGIANIASIAALCFAFQAVIYRLIRLFP